MSQLPPQQNLRPEPDHGPPTNSATGDQTGHKSASTEEHRAQSPDSVKCFVLTVSDTRTLETDKGGALIEEFLSRSGHQITAREVVRDEMSLIENSVHNAMNGVAQPDAIIVTGGSGISRRDVTPEALRPLLTKEMPGFGEVFRMLSWQEVGPATMLSRAFAGVIGGTLLFVLPGSTNAVRLAMEKLIAPELGHLVREARGPRE